MRAERPIIYSTPMVRQLPPAGPKRLTRRIVNEKTLRVRMSRTVTSDTAEYFTTLKTIRAKPGTYRARMNKQGAVSIDVGGGTWLGVKPGEFDFVCPYADGKTHLADHGGGRKLWTIIPDAEQLLWVRETWAPSILDPASAMVPLTGENCHAVFRADGEGDGRWTSDSIGPDGKLESTPTTPSWRPSIHMPKWAARIWLEVTGVRVERLQDISEEDARAEGVNTSALTPSPREPINAKNYVHAREAFADLWRVINGAESWDANPWVWVVSFKRAERSSVRVTLRSPRRVA